MQKRFVAIAIAIVGVASVSYYLFSTPVALRETRSSVGTAASPAEPLDVANRNRNPLQVQKHGLDTAKLEEAFGCVNPSGIITCGKYKDGPVMYYAALAGSKETLDRFAHEAIVKSQANAALNVAAALGDSEMVRHIYQMGQRYGVFNAISIDEHAAIQAARFGHVDILDFFYARGLDINQRFSDGYTDLFVEALVERHPSVIKYLIDRGYRIECDFRFPNGKSYDDIAIQLELPEISQAIHEECTDAI